MRTLVPGVLVLLFASCATPLPGERAERGLYSDLHKQVRLRESDDWVVDRVEVEEALPTALLSACQVGPGVREGLLRWLDDRIEASGGPARHIFELQGDSWRFRRVRRLERVRLLAEEAHRAAVDCPYWLHADPEFAGVQSDEGRFVLIGETLGAGTLFMTEDDVSFGGGGGARVLVARGLTPRWTGGVGFELGGVATLEQTAGGKRAFEGNFTGALPLLLRWQDITRMIDLEVAVTTRWTDGDTRLPPGVRFGIGYGLSALRVASFMPYAGVWVGYEVVPAGDGFPVLHALMLGTRVGVDWDP